MFPIIYPTKDLYSEYIETSADQDTESNLKKQAKDLDGHFLKDKETNSKHEE